jgi:hypothetical protein
MGVALRCPNWFYLLLAVLLLAGSHSGPSFAQSRIGSAASITNQVEGVVRGGARPLVAGGDVHANELVRTQAESVAQLVFLDNTNLSIGPKSSVVLDRFVYDPDRSTGRVVLRTTQGVFRFVTGSQPPQNYTIRTPVATIGVRGTVFDLLVQANKIVVILVSGEVRITTAAGRAVQLNVPGTAVTVFAGGRIIGPVNWNGQTIITAGGTPFPYFGNPIAFVSPLPASQKIMVAGLHPIFGVEGGLLNAITKFDVAPPFDVRGTAGVIGVYGGLMYMPPGSNFFFGPRIGALFGFGSGSITNPPASPAFTYKVELPWTFYYEAEFGTVLSGALSNMSVHGSVGAATVNTVVTGTTPGFSVTSNVTRTGLTASGGIDIAVSPAVSLGAQFRYINAPSGDVMIPGKVPISSNIYIGTVGATWHLSGAR